MMVYCRSDTPSFRLVTDLGCGVGEMVCLECGGDGDASKFWPAETGVPPRCLECKGTGRQLIGL